MALKNQVFYADIWVVDRSSGAGKTGDAANITLKLVQDGGTPATPNNSVVEVNSVSNPGLYKITLTTAEMNYESITIHGVSSTTDVTVYPRYIETYTGIRTLLERLGVPVNIDSGGATIADNLKKIADDNGGADFDATFDSLHAQTAQIGEISPSNEIANAQVVTNGTVDSGTYSSTALKDGIYFQLSPNGTPLDFYMKFPLGDRRPDTVKIFGRMNQGGGTRYADLFAYNFETPGWDPISAPSNRMNEESSDQEYIYTLLSRHKDPVTNEVWIRWLSNDGSTDRDLYLDSVWVSAVSQTATVEEIADAVYNKMAISVYNREITLDSNNGSSGVEVGVNGLPGNPCDNLSDAYDLAVLIGLRSFFVQSESSFSLERDCAQTSWKGIVSTLNLAGYDVDSCSFDGFVILGTCTSSTGIPLFKSGVFLSASLPPCTMKDMGFADTIVFNAAGDYIIKDCASGVAGSGRPVFDFNGNICTINLRNYNGGFEARNMVDGCKISFDGRGQFYADSSCSGGEVVLRGPIKKELHPSAVIDVIEGNRLTFDRADEFIYYDDNNGSAGLDRRLNGTIDNPSNDAGSTIAMANDQNKAIKLLTGSALELVSETPTEYYHYEGFNASLDFNSADVLGSYFKGLRLTGTTTVTSGKLVIEDCIFELVTLPSSDVFNSSIENTLTLVSGGEYSFKNCKFGKFDSSINYVVIDFDGNDCVLNIDNFSGKINIINNTHATGTVNINGNGSVSIDSSCTSPILPFIAGNIELTNNGTANVTDTARIDQQNVRDSLALATTDSVLTGSIDEKLGTPVDLDGAGASLAGNTEDIFNKLDSGGLELADSANNKGIIDEGVWETRATIDSGTPALALEEIKQATANDFEQDSVTKTTDIKKADGTTNAFQFQLTKNTTTNKTTKERL